MSYPFLLPAMLFLHVLDDYFLQAPTLGRLKCKSWWKENAPDPHYKHDFVPALICHAFSWAFLTMLPVAFYYDLNPPAWFYLALPIHTAVHAITDHLKANVKLINLVTDQTVHLAQILSIWAAVSVL